ncbi:Ntc20p Ecym_7049 [Eremothecium cymbalariae DBVPG|uniref:Uncharacterized protein n=1 Tax=Eremothecium cymbalariae (strain CBS 270.75 / DBVPG 7215 / KCTC 17166 / NRRL Y-17582) TaxID=931890 RepID=G8JVP0_ERECY|nr:hypothetical protein Ecym_7049 [Eremothecium cymbalariae DBVPG\
MATLESQISERKKRLELLKSKNLAVNLTTNQQGTNDGEQLIGNDNGSTPVVRSRNFDLETKMPISEPRSYHELGETVETLASKVEQEMLVDLRKRAKELMTDSNRPVDSYGQSVLKTSTKKSTHDLKLKLAPSLEELEKRTDEAINRILRKRFFIDNQKDN